MHGTEHLCSSCWTPQYHPALGSQFQQSRITGVKFFFITPWTAASGSYKVMSSPPWILVNLASPAGPLQLLILWSVGLGCSFFSAYDSNPAFVSLHIPVVKWRATFCPVTECTPSAQSWVCQSDLVGWDVRRRKQMFSFSLNKRNVRLLTVTKTSQWTSWVSCFSDHRLGKIKGRYSLFLTEFSKISTYSLFLHIWGRRWGRLISKFA